MVRKKLKKIHPHTLSLGIFFLLFIIPGGFFYYSQNNPPRKLEVEDGINENLANPILNDVEAKELETPPGNEKISTYIKIINSCNFYYGGDCVVARSGPGTDHPIVNRLRNDIVLNVADLPITNSSGKWYKILFNEHLYYPERVQGDMYVSADYVEAFTNPGNVTSWKDGKVENNKRIIVDKSSQSLYAFDDEELFMVTHISAGLDLSPTPVGTFSVFQKMPSRYMQGPAPDSLDTDVYDLPGVPWNMYFTIDGAVIHGAYWHDDFGTQHSHGCVNLRPDEAQKLYEWADLGTEVIIQD